MILNIQNIKAVITAAITKKTENAVLMIFVINKQSICIFSIKSSSKTQISLSLNNIFIMRIFFVTSSTKHNHHIIIETDSLKVIKELIYVSWFNDILWTQQTLFQYI